MQIALQDLDPQIAEKVKTRAATLFFSKHLETEDIEAQNVFQKRWKGVGKGYAKRALIGSMTGLGVGMALAAMLGGPPPRHRRVGLDGLLSWDAWIHSGNHVQPPESGSDKHECGGVARHDAPRRSFPYRSDLY